MTTNPAPPWFDPAWTDLPWVPRDQDPPTELPNDIQDAIRGRLACTLDGLDGLVAPEIYGLVDAGHDLWVSIDWERGPGLAHVLDRLSVPRPLPSARTDLAPRIVAVDLPDARAGLILRLHRDLTAAEILACLTDLVPRGREAASGDVVRAYWDTDFGRVDPARIALWAEHADQISSRAPFRVADLFNKRRRRVDALLAALPA